MKKSLLFILFVLLRVNCYSQDKEVFYIDERYKEISLTEFESKAQSNFYLIATSSNDTAIFKKIRFREYFGKLDTKKKHQLNKLLYQKHKIDSTKIWLIHHIDSLPNIDKFREKSGIILLDSLGNEFGKIMNVKEFNFKHAERLYHQKKINFYKTHKMVTSYKNYKKNAVKEKREFGRFKNLELLHFYNFNKNYPLENDQFNWKHDSNQIFQKVFTDGNKMYLNLIIFPNGDFYTHSGRASLKKQKKLLKKKFYDRLKKDWLNNFYK